MGLVVSRLPSQLSGWLSGKVTEKSKPDEDKRFSDTRCQDFVVRAFPL